MKPRSTIGLFNLILSLLSLPAAVAEVLLLRAVAVDSGLFLSLFLVGIVVVTVAGEPETADLSTSGRISNDMSSKLGFLAF